MKTTWGVSPSKEYNAMGNFLFFANLALSLGVLLIMIVFDFSIFLRAFLAMYIPNPFMLTTVFFLIFYILATLFSLPLDFYEGFVLEHQFNLSRETVGGWFKDHAKKVGIGLCISLILVYAVYGLLSAFPATWWVIAAFVWLFMTVILAKIFPVIILPLFFKSSVLADTALQQQLTTLAEKFRFSLSAIFVLELSKKTVKANAMITGLGSTKRIYLSDTLVNNFSHDEVEVVVAHELAHNKHFDLYKHLAVSFCSGLVSFYACDVVLGRAVSVFGYWGKNDIATLPLLLLLVVLVSIVLLPLQNGFSRFCERAADRRAITTTTKARAFISMMTKLGEKNLADFSPNRLIKFFLYDHPPIAKRIALAEQLEKSQLTNENKLSL